MAPAGCCCGGCWGGAVAAADAARRVLVLLLLLGVLSAGPGPGALATEHYSPLSLLKQELQHRQQQEAPAGGGCSPQSGDWGDQYSAECGGEWGAAGGRQGCGGVPARRGRRGCGPRRRSWTPWPRGSRPWRVSLREPASRNVAPGPLPAARTHAAVRPPPEAALGRAVNSEKSWQHSPEARAGSLQP